MPGKSSHKGSVVTTSSISSVASTPNPSLDVNTANPLSDVNAITSGGNFTAYPPVFTPDSKYFLCCADGKVHLYSALTGLRVHTLTGHRATVTSIQISPENPLQAFTCSLDGDIRVWDYLDAVCLRVYTVGVPMVKMLMNEQALRERRVLYVVSAAAKKRGKKSKVCKKSAGVASIDHPTADGNDDATMKTGTSNVSEKINTGEKPRQNIYEVCLDPEDPSHHSTDTYKSISGGGGGGVSKVSLRVLMKISSVRDWTFSPDGTLLAVLSKISLVVIDLPNRHRTKFVNKASRFSCVRFHPNGDTMVTGDDSGRITLWYSIRDTIKYQHAHVTTTDCITSFMHWHAHAVSSLSFTSDGAYLLSGGVEAVLVIWSLSNLTKQFLPRLGAPIRYLSVSDNEEMYMLAYVTNTIHIVSAASLKILQEIRGLVLRPPAVVHRHHHHGLSNANTNTNKTNNNSTSGISETIRSCIPLSLSVNPRDNTTVAFNRLPGSVQFYDILSDRPVSTLGVVQHMYVSGTQTAQIDQPLTDVRQVAYTFNGKGMVTIEGKQNEPRLKFWDWDDSNQTFTLNTFTETAHMDEVLSVGVDPSHNVIATTSSDETFKLWVMKKVTVRTNPTTGTTANTTGTHNDDMHDEVSTHIRWNHVSTASYRGMTPNCCAFSHDGSLLAVGFDHVLTLWVPHTNTLLRSLMHTAGPSQPITSVAFASIPSKSLPLLITATPDYLFVWNLLTCAVYWSYKVKVTLLTTVPSFTPNNTGNTEGYFAIVARMPGSQDGYVPEVVIEFSAESPVPLRISPVPVKESVEGMAYLTGNTTSSKPNAFKHHATNANVNSINNHISHTTPPALAIATTSGIMRMIGGGYGAAAKQLRKKSLQADSVDMVVDNSDVFGGDKKPPAYTHMSSDKHARVGDKDLKPSDAVFTAPSHLVPPCTALYESFMTLLLDNAGSSKVPSATTKSNDMDVDTLEDTSQGSQTSAQTENMIISANNEDLDGEDEFDYLQSVFESHLMSSASLKRSSSKSPKSPNKPHRTPSKPTPSNITTPLTNGIILTPKANGVSKEITPKPKMNGSESAPVTPKGATPSIPSKKSKTSLKKQKIPSTN
eukprot:CFRG0341T1